MVQLIVGKKGKGKTKILLEKVNKDVKEVGGRIVYLDKNSKHMYELNNKVRLVDVSAYPINNKDAFLGFVCGILSRDSDIEQFYLDSFLKLAHLEEDDIQETVEALDRLAKEHKLTFILSVSTDADHIPDSLRDKILVSL
ncbi:MAG: twitching motility protein PilT [Lachnospiraceae bacterium]|nr:twitching motility protein PilT [Lachnospiraceae bacterium]MDY5742390.1 twitching motility protein PilT [Lachnospiraceae bacterium]